ncbi:MAG: response regulator [Myxococcaceae bacterium]|nr:response regulator [Myxococcaceae bacterium]
METATDPTALLAAVVTEERERIARLWSKRLSQELGEVEARARDLRAPLLDLVTELGRLLRDRGEDALRLWPEVIRAHGAARFDLRFEPEDLSREFKALQQVLLQVYVRHRGRLEPEVANLIAELVGEGAAAAHSSYARLLRTEEVRLRENAVMESLLQHIEIGVILAEIDGRVTYATPPVSTLLGLPARVLTGANVDALRAILAQLDARHLDGERFRVADLPLVRALREKQEVRNISMLVKRPSDGREVVIEMTALPVREEGSNELYGVVQTLADRTEATQKSRSLTQEYEHLRRLQGRLLQRTRAQALGQLASGAAHNLNNFLNVIRLRMTLLRREFKPEYLDALDRTVTNIGELVARLQDFSSQRELDEPQPEHFNAAVREGLELVRREVEQGREPVHVIGDLAGDPVAKFDPISLRELIVNLVLSARTRMKDGGEVHVRSRTRDGWIEISLEFLAPPFTTDEIVRLFDPLKGATPAPQLSLLLAVGRHQVQKWGGELWVENLSDGSGSAFRLRLPMVAELQKERQAVEAERAGRPARPEARRVLVVDDEPENARMMSEVLAEEGYEVGVATTGEEALKMWRQSHFDAALLDALLPDLSGWAIAREIRKDRPDALVAVVTGGDVRGQNRDNLALVDAVFRKPIDVGALDEFLSQTNEGGTEGGEPSEPVVH